MKQVENLIWAMTEDAIHKQSQRMRITSIVLGQVFDQVLEQIHPIRANLVAHDPALALAIVLEPFRGLPALDSRWWRLKL